MSEFNPFSAEQAPVYVPEESEDSAEGGRKKVVALGALAAVVLGAGAFFFLGGGEEEEDFTPIARAPRAEAPAADAGPAVTLPVASNVTLGRNPFRALYVEPAAEPVAAPAPVSQPVAPAPAPVSGGTSTGGSTYVPPPTQPAPAPAPAQSTVALKKVAAGEDGSNPTGTFVYDGKTVTGAPGDVMDGKLLVISLQQDHTGSWFAVLQLGDGSPFEVHQNQVVVVQ